MPDPTTREDRNYIALGRFVSWVLVAFIDAAMAWVFAKIMGFDWGFWQCYWCSLLLAYAVARCTLIAAQQVTR